MLLHVRRGRSTTILGQLSTFASFAAVSVCIYLPQYLYVYTYYVYIHIYIHTHKHTHTHTHRVDTPLFLHAYTCNGADRRGDSCSADWATGSRATASGSMPCGVWRCFHFYFCGPCPAARQLALKHPCGISTRKHPQTPYNSQSPTNNVLLPGVDLVGYRAGRH